MYIYIIFKKKKKQNNLGGGGHCPPKSKGGSVPICRVHISHVHRQDNHFTHFLPKNTLDIDDFSIWI